ncbi:MAG: dipeptidase [Bacteroidota bacterium]
MNSPRTFVETEKNRLLEELFELLRIPSISADSAYAEQVKEAAGWLERKLTDIGLPIVTTYQTSGHPIVFASTDIDPAKSTVLVYGHYDVQPPDPLDLWTSPPFEPVIQDEKIYARGSSDDKGQMYMHVKAVEYLLQQDSLPCNIKLLIEGEEEVGSDNLDIFVEANKELLAADMVLISDTSMLANDTPSITIGLRGMSYVEVELTGPNRDLHSGVYGGAVANPINVLCEMIASLKDETGKITIPGFYDKVEELTHAERDKLAERPHDEASYCEDLGLANTGGEVGYSTTERATIRPTLDVNGIWGGYIGEGAKTVLPAKASAKLSMRLVPHQTPEEITQLFTDHFKKIAPPTVKVEVRPHHGGDPAVVSTTSPGYLAAEKAMQKSFGKKPIPTREGGSIPIVALFKNTLGIETVLMGFGLDSDAIHSPNEHYGIFNYLKGIETIIYFHQFLSEGK